MDWAKDGPTWPNADLSRFIESPPHRWHVQEAGEGPLVLLLHGAAGATHSWRDLLPILARGAHVVAPDLPGHGFTRLGTRQRSSLPRMAASIVKMLMRPLCGCPAMAFSSRCRSHTAWSLKSWAGVIFTQPVPNSGST